jgi:hypothetical protein
MHTRIRKIKYCIVLNNIYKIVSKNDFCFVKITVKNFGSYRLIHKFVKTTRVY